MILLLKLVFGLLISTSITIIVFLLLTNDNSIQSHIMKQKYNKRMIFETFDKTLKKSNILMS